MENIIDLDYLKVKNEQYIESVIKNELLLFSGEIIKINKNERSQLRNFIITNQAIYNFNLKDLRRKFKLEDLKGISVSKLSDSFVLHCKGLEYDYNLASSFRLSILEIIGNAYKKLVKSELLLNEMYCKSLHHLTTKKSEKIKDPYFSRMPLNNHKTITEYVAYQKLILNQSPIIYINKEKQTEFKDVSNKDFKEISEGRKNRFGNRKSSVIYQKTNEMFSMMCINKQNIDGHDKLLSILHEKSILESLEHPFLCSLVSCFQTKEMIYFLLNHVKGVSLHDHLKSCIILPEEDVRFYAAQIGLALQYLHEKGIIYRDFKSDNIIISEDGYLQLSDFEFSKELTYNEKSKSFIGSPEYLSPEVIEGAEYNCLADWWSYGALM